MPISNRYPAGRTIPQLADDFPGGCPAAAIPSRSAAVIASSTWGPTPPARTPRAVADERTTVGDHHPPHQQHPARIVCRLRRQPRRERSRQVPVSVV
jgi:hypothetical protein